MSKNPEGRFYESIERRLDPDIHREGMANPYRGGTPDRFYEGDRSNLWVEYKWLAKRPAKQFSLTSGLKPKLTPLQQEWLNRRYDHGFGDVMVIVGWPGEKRNSKEGVILQNKDWMAPVDMSKVRVWPSADIGRILNDILVS